MTLKRQLLLLGLLTLALPWLAVSYIQQLDSTLRQSRLDSVEQLAASVAHSLSKEGALIARLKQRNLQTPALFTAELPKDYVLDGYLTEWYYDEADNPEPAQRYSKNNGWQPFIDLPAGVLAAAQFALVDDGLWLGVAVTGVEATFFSPQRESYDALILRFSHGVALRVITSVAGVAEVQRWQGGRWRRHFEDVALWQMSGAQTSDSLQTIELSLPLAYREHSVTVEYASAALGYSVFLSPQNNPVHLAYRDAEFTGLVSDYASEQQRVTLYDWRGLPVQGTGSLVLGAGLPEFNERNSWLMRLYFLLSGRPEYRYQAPQVPMSTEHSEWFFNRVSPVARAVVALGEKGQEPVGWLVLDKQDARFYILLAGIYGQFVFVCTIFAGVVVIALLGFSSVHSWRIRSLAKHAEQAIDSMGNVRAPFRSSRIPDEIGQLSRSFEALLRRLGAHQEYLKSLAVKLSHELRTPLAITQSSLDNLEASVLDVPQRRYVERARGGMARLSSTLNAMSSVNSLEQALMHAESETFCIKNMLTMLVDAYQDNYPQQVVLRGFSEASRSYPVVAAPELIVQMLDKLVENASQLAPKDSTIEIHVNWPQEPATELTLRVINTGPPLPSAIEQQIFDSMVSSREASQQGDGVHLGLGLYIARLICEFHGGSIRASSVDASEPNQALVTFEIILPIISEG